MKKTFSIIIALLMLAVLTITASAAGVTATTENKSCAKGSTVTLNVSLSGSTSVLSGAVEVVYDKTKLQLVEGAWNTTGALLTNFDTSKDKGAFAFASASNVSGKIFSVKFKVLSDAPLGDTEVKCIIQLKDGSNNDIAVTNKSGKITVTCNHSFTKKTTDYPASPASCTSAAKYYYSCSICGEKGNTTYTVGSPTSHTFDKKVSTETYLVNSVTCVNEAEYYYSCACGAKGTEKFTADASWSHNFSDNWFISADGHWHQCLDCGAKKDNALHTASANNVCGQCQFVLSNDGTHYHSFGNTWVSNNDAHWHECSCGLKNDMELHNWDNGTETKPATTDADGEMFYTCLDCGKTKTETIEKLNTEANGGNTGDNNSPAPMGTGEIILFIGIGMLSLAALEGAAFLVYKFVIKKDHVEVPEKKAENSPNKNESNDSADS